MDDILFSCYFLQFLNILLILKVSLLNTIFISELPSYLQILKLRNLHLIFQELQNKIRKEINFNELKSDENS